MMKKRCALEHKCKIDHVEKCAASYTCSKFHKNIFTLINMEVMLHFKYISVVYYFPLCIHIVQGYISRIVYNLRSRNNIQLLQNHSQKLTKN